jgi:hypothetical protein
MKLFLLAVALVADSDLQAGVEIRHLAQVAHDVLVLELHLGKNFPVGREGGLGAGLLGRAALLDFGFRDAAFVALKINLAVLADLDLELIAQGVDDRGADAMESARHFVGILFELAARMQHGMHDFERRALFGRMHVDWNSAAVVLDRNPIVAQNYGVDLGTETGQRFIDGVVDDLSDEMMQAALGGVADVHSGALANCFESFENLDGLGAIAVRRLFICHRKRRARTTLPHRLRLYKIVCVTGEKVKAAKAVEVV